MLDQRHGDTSARPGRRLAHRMRGEARKLGAIVVYL
jgi:hypothetical protein